MRNETILIVDDEKLIRWSLKSELQKAGFNVLEAEQLKHAFTIIAEHEPDLILLDQRLPDGTGIELLQKMRDDGIAIPAIMLTVIDTSHVAVQAMKLGAIDYVTKPVDVEALLALISKALEQSRLSRRLVQLKRENEAWFGERKLIGTSSVMLKVFECIAKIAESNTTTVLITGESGTGKELVARAIHSMSLRKDQAFMAVNCSALAENLIESELFGHEKGAFTDARTKRKGIFELADEGVVFLDEIGDISSAVQTKLLRVLEERTIRRVGGSNEIAVDVRVIAASNQKLEELMLQGKFRSDLYYRLNVANIELPPLRTRGDDIILLAEYFLNEFNQKFHKNFKGLSEETKKLFRRYEWPGNVRELRNVVERATLLDEGDYIFSHGVHLGHLHELRQQQNTPTRTEAAELSLHQLEKRTLQEALQRTKGNQVHAAKLLGITRDTLRYRIKKYGLARSKDRGV